MTAEYVLGLCGVMELGLRFVMVVDRLLLKQSVEMVDRAGINCQATGRETWQMMSGISQ